MKCKHCGEEMTAGATSKYNHISLRDWNHFKKNRKDLEWLKDSFTIPSYWCGACIHRGREDIKAGRVVSAEEMLAKLHNSSVEEYKKQREKRRLEMPDDERTVIRITLDDVNKALSELEGD